MPDLLKTTKFVARKALGDREEIEIPKKIQTALSSEILKSLVSKIPELLEQGIEPRAWWEATHSW